jgi:diguanylate cyclase (GGDEF)-like protein
LAGGGETLRRDHDGPGWFKPVNDLYGHDAGDEVLQIIGGRLNNLNRLGDLASRLGGDEFAVILHDCPNAAAAHEISLRFIAAIARPIRLSVTDETVAISASAGVAHAGDGAATAEAILKRADEALYSAKRAGKNRVA